MTSLFVQPPGLGVSFEHLDFGLNMHRIYNKVLDPQNRIREI
jgi:hypothetical protein